MNSLKRMMGGEQPRYPLRNGNKIQKAEATTSPTKFLTKVAVVVEDLMTKASTAFDEKAAAECHLDAISVEKSELIEQLDTSNSKLALQQCHETSRSNKLATILLKTLMVNAILSKESF